MDMNVVFECIGYGAKRAVFSANFPPDGACVPARYILETALDPVAFCIDAYAIDCPVSAASITDKGRAMILDRLEYEAGVTRH